ncbi:T-cell surface glycoprotein CD4-like [Chaetodon trifascialis]|uniref:T-cell surface glycoprotein CD4-like n=1 Tax=Chaetodon trifascialis TaxID=109706 RepID=UPI003993FEF9
MKITVWFGVVLGALSAAGEVIIAKAGQAAILKCGNPTNDYERSLEWRHGNDKIYSAYKMLPAPRKGQGEIVERSRLSNTDLRIRGVKEQDAGKFTCQVDGKSHEHILLVVSVSLRSSADLRLDSEVWLECNVKGLNPGPAVRWTRPDGSVHTESQIAHLKPLARSDEGTWSCTFSHAGKTHSEIIEIKVKEPVRTTLAPVPSKNPKDVRVINPPLDTKPGLGLSWWMWVVIGVGCVVVLLLMVFVICLCKRIKRRKRILRKMKNGRQRPMPEQYCQCNRPTAAAKPQQGRRREKPSAPPLQPLLMG